jgi:hypothetical protein
MPFIGLVQRVVIKSNFELITFLLINLKKHHRFPMDSCVIKHHLECVTMSAKVEIFWNNKKLFLFKIYNLKV